MLGVKRVFLFSLIRYKLLICVNIPCQTSLDDAIQAHSI